jgi:riboflavin kinase/FMN adenylyltransferase
MDRHYGLPAGLFTDLPSPVVSFGVYDGVHRGHQAVLAEAAAWAHAQGGKAVVLTFFPHPQAVLRNAQVPLITSVARRLDLLEAAGADLAVVLPFTLDLAQLAADEFLDRFLTSEFRARGLVLGYEQRFGRNADGNFDTARRWGSLHGVEVRRGPEVELAGTKISSSAIRMAISSGRLREASLMLGRAPSIEGTVVRGDGRGGKIGIPTANLDLVSGLLPPRGVYLAHAEAGGGRLRAVVNIGVRPTFAKGAGADIVEVHLLDWTGDLYGSTIEVVLERKLRDEKKFESAEALVAQIRADIREAREADRS